MQTELSHYVRDESYKQIINDNHTDIQREIIRNTILNHPEGITDLEICITTGIRRSSVTARRNEIPDMMAIGIAKITDEYGDRFNTLWSIDNNGDDENSVTY